MPLPPSPVCYVSHHPFPSRPRLFAPICPNSALGTSLCLTTPSLHTIFSLFPSECSRYPLWYLTMEVLASLFLALLGMVESQGSGTIFPDQEKWNIGARASDRDSGHIRPPGTSSNWSCHSSLVMGQQSTNSPGHPPDCGQLTISGMPRSPLLMVAQPHQLMETSTP